MTTPRAFYSATLPTLLVNGKVLITGGARDALAAELYDPATGTFTATGNMIYGRGSCTLLLDGRVLCIGAGAEFYDPLTGTFTARGTTTAGGIATLLGNGKVLITGVGDTAELYDPATDKFAPTGAYAGDFYYGTFYYPETATLLPDGRVLIVGNAAGDGYLERDELYDPVTGTFKLTGKTHTFNCRDDILLGHTATLLANGKVLLTGGGQEDCGTTRLAELYDPATETLTVTGNMTMARAGHSATLLPNGTVLIAGGQYGGPITSAELYNPATGTFSATGNMTTPRSWQAATLLLDGTVLMTGARSDTGVVLASAELYTPAVLVPAPMPMLLSLSGDGKGQGAIQHAGTTRIASGDDPAVTGEYLSIYLKGLTDGTAIPPQLAIGGKLAEISFFGNVPGYPGLNVINVRMPSGVATGLAVPVRLTYLGRLSNEVTIGVTLEVAMKKAIAAMKAAAGTDSLNFWQWAWYWQKLPPFSGAPAGFGVGGSISPDVMAQTTTAGGGDPLRNVSAEQWVSCFRQMAPQ